MTINKGKVTCILVSGAAGVGKDTVSDLLAVHLEHGGLTVSRDSFAISLKLIARRFMGWDGKKDDRGRSLLQGLGELGREYDEYTWCKIVKDRAEECVFQDQVLIISDWRYMNEKQFFEDDLMYDVVTVKVVGNRAYGLSDEQKLHASEKDISENMRQDDFDLVIPNSESLEKLQDKVIWIANMLIGE